MRQIPDDSDEKSGLFWLALLTVRGVLLWIVIPIVFLSWLVSWPHWHRKHIQLSQLLGWSDLNLVAAIERSILRPFVTSPAQWVSYSEISNVTHEIGLTDPV